MNKKIILIYTTLICNTLYGQVTVAKNFNLELAEKDSITTLKLETSLNGFLTEAQNGEYSNKYTDSLHIKKYDFFFRKLSFIGNDTESIKFNKPSVLKSYSSDGNNYRLTVAFSGLKDSIPFIFQVTELKAVPYQNHYKFYCPFEENTKNFKNKKINTVTYYYSGSLNEAKAKEFTDFKDKLCKLTNTPKKELNYYCFQSLDELLKSYGFLYSARQCNFLCYDLGFSDNQGKMFLTGTNDENYLSEYVEDFIYYNLPNEEEIYWPFLTGVSTYYGGYGLKSVGMDELKQDLREELKRNPSFNFLDEFNKGRKSSVKRHFSHYVISSILCEEVLNKKGFNEVLKLVYSGNKGEHFFENLKSILNIEASNFHNKIASLIKKSN